jgi:hypothetical protein
MQLDIGDYIGSCTGLLRCNSQEKKMRTSSTITNMKNHDGFINILVLKETRRGLHQLKESMGVASQAEVIEKAVAILQAIQQAAKK